MPHLSLSLLGSPEFRLDGRLITDFHSDKVRALLIYLAVEASRAHRRESLAGLLWPDWPDASARKNLSNALYELRRCIHDREAHPPFLHVTRDTIQFNAASNYTLDVAQFSALVEGKEPQAHRWEEALDLYRGPFLEGFAPADSAPFEDWAGIQRERLARQATEALRGLAAHWEEGGEFERACEASWRRVELEPWREEAHRDLMRLLALTGRRSAALAQYEACRRALAEELNVEPSKETVDLYERIRDGRLGEGETERTRNSDGGPRPHNLPIFLTPLIGRERELAEIAERLADPDCRLLTLVGPGGSGKTRLAVEAATRAAADFSQGAFFVPLSSLNSAVGIIPAIAQALGFTVTQDLARFDAGPTGTMDEIRAQLLDHLRWQHMLLVLDNFEHLLDGIDIVVDILRVAPRVKILITSRERLNAQGEHCFPVEGLSVPQAEATEDAAEYGAVQLFLSTVRRVQPGLVLGAADMPYVVRTCRLVWGLPLGIVLAAPWASMLTFREMAEEVEHSADLLETRMRDIPERQRSIRATFDHSWRLLSEREREVMQALPIFRGSFTRQAAQQVADATLGQLRALVDKSLLHRTPEGRYELHDLMRQYAAEELDELPDKGEGARERYCACYVSAVQRWWDDLHGPHAPRVSAEVEAELANVRAAWEWAARQVEAEWLNEMLNPLMRLLYTIGRGNEPGPMLSMASHSLEIADRTGSGLGARALKVWSRILSHQSWETESPGERMRLLQAALSLLDRPSLAGHDTRQERALALEGLGYDEAGSDREQGERLIKESLALWEALGDQWSIAGVMDTLSSTATRAGDYETAKEWAEQSLALRQAEGDRYGIAQSMRHLSRIAAGAGDYANAREYAEESLEFWQEIGSARMIAWLLRVVSVPALAMGRLEEAEGLRRRSLELCQQEDNQSDRAWALYALGISLVVRGSFDEGANLIEQGLEVQLNWADEEHIAHAHHELARAYLHMGQYERAHGHAEAALAGLRGLGPDYGVVLALCALGCAALEDSRRPYLKDRCAEASRWLHDALAAARECRSLTEERRVDTFLAYVAATLGNHKQTHRHLLKALRRAVEIGNYYLTLVALPAYALLMSNRGEAESAVEVYALASREGLVGNSVWFEDVAGKHVAAVAESLPPEVVAAAQERGRARDLWETARELLAELEGEI